MPLDARKVNHIRRRFKDLFAERSSVVTLHLSDGTLVEVSGIWHWSVVDDPELPKQVHDIDATVLFLVADVSPGLLQRTLYVTPAVWEGAEVSSLGGRFLVSDILPKGTAWPPDRVLCKLRRGG